MTGMITDAMKQYERSTDEILKTHRRKRPSNAGVKLPDSTNLIAAITIIFVLIVAAVEIV
jgi:hypothetical protein